MPVTAQLDDGRTLEFPDGTEPSVVQATVKKMLAPKTAQPSALDRVMTGLADPVHGGAQMLTHALPDGVVDAGNKLNNWLADKTGLVAKIPEKNLSGLITGQKGGVDQMVADREKAYQAARGPDAGLDLMRIVGNVLSPVNWSIARLMPGAATLGGRVAVGAANGAVGGSLTPVTEGDFAEQKLKQTGVGALGGAAVPVIGAGVSRVVSPNASVNPQVALLKSEGVKPTIGQTLGGWANTLEEKAQSIPILGDAIAAARNRAREQFNTAAINRAAAPIGAKAEGAGQDAVAQVGDKISAAYDAAKNQLGHFTLDRQAASELNNLLQMTRNLNGPERAQFDKVWSYLDNAVSPNGSLKAEAFKQFDSKAGKEAARFTGASDAYQQQVGDAIKELQRIVLDAGKRANPKAAEAIDAADKAWANLVRVEGASKAALNNGGVFSPAQLQAAVRQADTSVRDRATARGQALMQDLSGAGQSVLGNRVPDSGTAGRVMLAGGATATGLAYPAIPIALAGGAIGYTPPVQALLRAAVSSRPQAAKSIAGLLEDASPMLAPAGGLLALDRLK
jgi:hypothetical protein